MATDIVMPQLGESIAEGTVIKWLIPPGGMVEKDQPLLEVETEKVALDIPAPATGVLREVLVQEGATVPVGTVLARLEHEPVETVMSRVGGVGVRARNSAAEGAPHYSPAVKQVAREHDIQLSEVTGSGEGGRITKKDVLDAVAKRGTSTPPPSAAPTLPNAEEELVPFNHMRKTIAERMVSSRRTSAHVTTFFEADCSGIEQFRAGRSLTYLSFVISAVSTALRALPMVNASWRDHGIVLNKALHIGIAVAIEDGLLVPVIRHADRKGLTQIAKEVADLAQRARSKRLAPEDVLDGTFTITNLGSYGIDAFTPIINMPEVAILGVGRIVEKPAIHDDQIVKRSLMMLSLTIDHRIVDGAPGADFLRTLKGLLEAPYRLLT